MWTLLIGMYLVTATGTATAAPALGEQCECFCVDGRLKTLCSGLAPAKASINFCHQLMNCRMPLAEPFTPEVYDAPTDGAENCRSARVWRGNFEDHQVVKICDT